MRLDSLNKAEVKSLRTCQVTRADNIVKDDQGIDYLKEEEQYDKRNCTKARKSA